MALFMVEINAKMVLFMACPTQTSPATSMTEKAKQVGYLFIMAPVSTSVLKVSSLSVLSASLEETVREVTYTHTVVLEAPRCSHHRQPVSTSGSKARVQTARPATLETASDMHEVPAC